MSRRLAVRSPADPLPWVFGAVLVALVAISAASFVLRGAVVADARTAAVEGATVVGDATAVLVAGATRPAEATLRTIAGSLGAEASLAAHADRVLALAGPPLASHPSIDAIQVWGRDGTVQEVRREAGGDIAVTQRQALAPEQWIALTRAEPGVVWTAPAVADDGRTLLHVALAARNRTGEVVGAVVAVTDSRVIEDALAASSGVRFGTAAVTGDGVLLAGDSAVEPPAGTRVATGSGAVIAHGTSVYYERPVDASLPWTLAVQVEGDAVLPTIATLERTMLTFVIFVLTLAVVLGLILWVLRLPAGELSARARTDALTGLSNRHHFEVRGHDVLQAARRRSARVVVAVFDLDNFTSVNDGAGHEIGDAALRAVADGLVEASGPRDVVARLGGDEFAVMLWMAAHDDAERHVERMRTCAQDLLEEAVGERFDVGVSAGWVDTSRGEYRLSNLVRAADHAMVSGRRTEKGAAYEGAHG